MVKEPVKPLSKMDIQKFYDEAVHLDRALTRGMTFDSMNSAHMQQNPTGVKRRIK